MCIRDSCVDNVFRLWQEGAGEKLTQLIFCDLSTPGKGFNIYDDIKKKLADRGVPESEIAFIHDANTDEKKKALFSRVRSGNVRVLLGSTAKMGAGTNVQDRLVALHDLDAPWRPGDLEQRKGRIARQGNMNETVHVYRYVTEQTFEMCIRDSSRTVRAPLGAHGSPFTFVLRFNRSMNFRSEEHTSALQ